MREVGVKLLVLGVAGQIFEKFDIRLEFAVAAVVGFRAETKYRRIVVYLVARTRIRHIAVPAAGDGTSEKQVELVAYGNQRSGVGRKRGHCEY